MYKKLSSCKHYRLHFHFSIWKNWYIIMLSCLFSASNFLGSCGGAQTNKTKITTWKSFFASVFAGGVSWTTMKNSYSFEDVPQKSDSKNFSFVRRKTYFYVFVCWNEKLENHSWTINWEFFFRCDDFTGWFDKKSF